MLASVSSESIDFHDLMLWHDCRHLLLEVFKITDRFPKTYNSLSLHLRRECLGITSDIAQAFGDATKLSRSHFLSLGISKTECLLTDLNRAKKLGFLENSSLVRLVNEIEQIKQTLSFFVQNHSIESNLEFN